MLTGKLPIESDSATGYLTAHLVSPPATLAEARPDRAWPPELEALIARMMGKSRDERPASCREILEEFRKIRPMLTTKQLEPPPPEPANAEPPREPEAHGVMGLLGRLLKKG
jgi:serine/threonine-protein kinase